MVQGKRKPLGYWLAAGGVVMTIALFLLPPKSPTVVVTLLALMFLLLVHSTWNFWWIEDRRWRQITAVALLASAIAIFGVYVWPSQEIASPGHLSMTELFAQWLARGAAYVGDLPRQWILLIGVVIGIVATAALGFLTFGRRRSIEGATPKVEILTPLNAELAPIRLIRAKPHYSSDSKLTFPSKVRCEFENTSGLSIKVRNSDWIPGAGGVTAELPAATLQIRVAGKWYPPDGTEEVHVPPGERFMNWIAPARQFTEDELQRRCDANDLGTIVLLVDGHEVKVGL
jgi:hypothetical protein